MDFPEQASSLQPIRHLYVHVPFCTHICPYCSFYKTRNSLPQIKEFLPALKAELAWAREQVSLEPETIFFGGGTPSALSLSQLENLFSEWPFTPGQVREFTLEANPTTISPDKARLLKSVGVNRISLGVQAFDEASLKILGRTHTAEQVRNTVSILRDAGFTNLNIDLMFALPGQTLAQWEHSLAETLKLQPQHVSAYNLNYEEDTEFFEKLQAGALRIDPGQEQSFFLKGLETLEQAGLAHYEISNYALPGFESTHNQAYWDGADYIGLGPGACSTVGNLRWKNVSNTLLYSEALLKKGEPLREPEPLSPEMKRHERILLGLRSRRGVALQQLSGKEAVMRELENEGLLQSDGMRINLTPKGQLVADDVTEVLL